MHTTPQHFFSVRYQTLNLFLLLDDQTLNVVYRSTDAKSIFTDSLSDAIDIYI